MNLPRDGTNELPKAGFDLIALKVIFQGRKMSKLANFDTSCPFIQNQSVMFPLFLHEASQDGDNKLWREGFDWIILKVIAKVRKVTFDPFSHISLY